MYFGIYIKTYTHIWTTCTFSYIKIKIKVKNKTFTHIWTICIFSYIEIKIKIKTKHTHISGQFAPSPGPVSVKTGNYKAHFIPRNILLLAKAWG
jgi:hypothetical protein